jgi:hypothetical protein
MDAETVRAIADALVTVWTLIGPLIAGLLGAWLTARHQRSLESERRAHESTESHNAWLRQQRAEICFRLLTTLNELSVAATKVKILRESTDPNADDRRTTATNTLMDRVGDSNGDLYSAGALGLEGVADRATDLRELFVDYALRDGTKTGAPTAWTALYSEISRTLRAATSSAA